MTNPFIKRRKPTKKRTTRKYKDGRQYLANKSELRQQAFERSGGHCEDQRMGSIMNEMRCYRPITWESMELSHRNHGSKRDDTLAGVLASCKECHQERHGSKCTYPRRAGKIMNANKAKEYWLGKTCFCSTSDNEVSKHAESSFCPVCMSKLSAALRYDLEHTKGDDYLKVLAECETAIMQFNIRGDK